MVAQLGKGVVVQAHCLPNKYRINYALIWKLAYNVELVTYYSHQSYDTFSPIHPMQLSLVVPVLNEEIYLPSAVPLLMSLQQQGVEVLLVDGGSADRTVALIKHYGLRVISAPLGRAKQMNFGALHTCGDILIFLHVDTSLPPAGIQKIQHSLLKDAAWGRFDIKISGQTRILILVAMMMNWRSKLTGIATGDQAMFMTRTAFNCVGGFPDQALMEDVEMSKRLVKLTRPAIIADKAVTSGRRWEERGVWATIFLMWRLRWAYWRGQSAEHLAQLYL